jgi:hypothetical protein
VADITCNKTLFYHQEECRSLSLHNLLERDYSVDWIHYIDKHIGLNTLGCPLFGKLLMCCWYKIPLNTGI